eukprot:scaffold7466_cov248-Pinguiococcus_pyrenoidosus.AAC.4
MRRLMSLCPPVGQWLRGRRGNRPHATHRSLVLAKRCQPICAAGFKPASNCQSSALSGRNTLTTRGKLSHKKESILSCGKRHVS